MLVLPIHGRGELIALDDDAAPERIWVSLARPRVARRADGSPALRLLRWTSQAASADPRLAGGRLTLDLETQPRDDEIAAAGFGSRAVSPLPWLDAKVRLEGPQFEPVETEVSIAGGGRATMAADLTPAAAAILAPLLLSDTVSPLQVVWTGHVRVRLPAVEVVATADVHEIRSRIAISTANSETSVTRSIIDGNARIEIRGTNHADLEQALRDWVLDELLRRLQRGEPLSVRAAAADVVRWPIQLATTLDALVTGSTRAALVETIVLGTAETGVVPPVEVRALGDFAGRLERVDVSLQPLSGSDSTRTAVDLQFTDERPQAARLGTSEYRWRHRIKRRDRPLGDWSAWVEVRGATTVLVPVPTPERVQVEILAVGIDFANRWSSVQVVIQHELPGGAPTIAAIDLDPAHPSRIWAAATDGVRGTLSARIRFLSRRGQVVERTVDHIEGDQLVLTDPLDGERLQLALVPSGTGWSDIALAMVDVRHVDGEQVVEETVELRTIEDFVAWEAPVRVGASRMLQWRLHASFKDGRFRSDPWQATEGGVAMVRIEGMPRRTVQLVPLYFDAAVTPKALIHFRSGDRTETLTVTDRLPRSVGLPAGPFTWSVTWTSADGKERPASPPEAGEDVLVLPRFRVPP